MFRDFNPFTQSNMLEVVVGTYEELLLGYKLNISEKV